ncbi:MAG: response regulator [Methyloprofundus sp.]|nr:response regulator [Methyloprofundus sp.]
MILRNNESNEMCLQESRKMLQPMLLRPAKVLIVEDDCNQSQLESDILDLPEYQVTIVETIEDAFDILLKIQFDVVLLDFHLPDRNGDDLCRWIRLQSDLSLLPIIIVTGSDSFSTLPICMDAGATDFIRKPFHPIELISRVNSAIRFKRITENLDSAQSLLFAIARLVEAKDEITGDHCSRLAHGCVVFGKALGLDDESLVALERGGILHDIGKLGIPDHILLKPGKLTKDEWDVMKQHVAIGEKLCSGLLTMKPVLPIIHFHHERWDGGGYLYGLKGEEIPLLARVFQLVDIYDALANDRPYKKALANGKIIEIFKQEVAKGWRDPELTAAFIHIIQDSPKELELPADYQDKSVAVFDDIVNTGVLQALG